MISPVEGILLDAKSALSTKGYSTHNLAPYRQVRVYAEWGGSVSAGVVTVRHRRWKATTIPAEDAGTLSFVAGKANSLRIEGPIGHLEVEITTAVVGGTVTAVYVAGSS